MLLDATLPPVHLNAVPPIASAAETTGFSCLWMSETQHDPFLQAALVAEHTAKISFGTAVAIAFARSPATLAYTAWDLSQASRGRFILGLGTQVKAHIERRFGLPWPESPVSKLREQVAAIRAFWKAWQTGEALDFRGEYYKLTLMSPFFNPGPIDYPDIPIYIAGVNTGLARLAGEAANGFHVHPFHTLDYLREVIAPAIQEGAGRNGRQAGEIAVAVTAFVASSPEEIEFARQQVAFYASTPSYRQVMALHGWQDAAENLSGLAARRKWDEMPTIISDSMLEAFVVIAPPAEAATTLVERYTGLADRLAVYLPFIPGERDDFWRDLCAATGA